MLLPPHYSFQESVVVAFMMELRLFEGLKPETISNYMVGARFFLENSNYDCGFWSRSKIIKATQQGMLVTYRASVNKADSQSLPLPCEAILYAIEHIYTDGSALAKMMIAAFCVAFLCLLRSCEYILKPAKAPPHHHLRGRDIVFDAVGTDGAPLLGVHILYCSGCALGSGHWGDDEHSSLRPRMIRRELAINSISRND
jgi:hypothetical protein